MKKIQYITTSEKEQQLIIILIYRASYFTILTLSKLLYNFQGWS